MPRWPRPRFSFFLYSSFSLQTDRLTLSIRNSLNEGGDEDGRPRGWKKKKELGGKDEVEYAGDFIRLNEEDKKKELERERKKGEEKLAQMNE